MFRSGLGTTLGTLTEQGLDLWLSLTIGVFVLFAIFACLLNVILHELYPFFGIKIKWWNSKLAGAILRNDV